jgi:CHAT domain-containing protein
MRWLEFELMAPLATPEIDGFSAREELKEVGNLLLLPWISDQPGNLNVSPDGHLWRVPWQAVATVAGVEGEIALAMHPSCRIVDDAPVVSAEPRVLLWVSRDEALPYIRQEAAMIQEIFPNARLCETAKDVRDSMRDGEWDVVHVAAHASHCNSNPMFSFFEISGEPIYATEIAQSGFTAKLSVLSACETGSLSFDRKDEPDGLARAFLARRASAVVGSAWRLDDEAAAVMMSAFYKTLAEKGGIVDAMREARTAAQSRWDHPYYWAPLVLFGGYV